MRLIGHSLILTLVLLSAFGYLWRESSIGLSNLSHDQGIKSIGSAAAWRWFSDPVAAAGEAAASNVREWMNLSIFVIPMGLAIAVAFAAGLLIYRDPVRASLQRSLTA